MVSVLEFAILAFAFRHESASKYHREKSIETTATRVNTKAIFKHLATWVSAAYFLADVGVETAISGWLVSFMMRARQTDVYMASLSSSAFWAGMAVGRLTLGNMTDRIGVRRATTIYIFFVLLLEGLFAVVRIPPVSILVMALTGFFMGPMFPSGIVVLTRLLPGELHVAAVSFVASIGQVGGALLPFGIGAVVESLDIQVFKYAIIVLSAVALVLWVWFARLRAVKILDMRGEEDDICGTHVG
jgi:fucose permease